MIKFPKHADVLTRLFPTPKKVCLIPSGRITPIPKREFRGFGGIPILNHLHFGGDIFGGKRLR